MYQVISFFGILFMLLVAWGLSNDRKAIPWRVVGGGLLLQILFALLIRRFIICVGYCGWGMAIALLLSMARARVGLLA